MFEHVEKYIGSYEKPLAGFHPYDYRAPEVARIIKEKTESYCPELKMEHIGSTAIPGCPGKGVIDMMALYPEDRLETTTSLLAAMGFQRQGLEFRNRFPDDRPVFMGTFNYDRTSFLVYVHVVRKDSYEAVRFRIFRDRLCADRVLLADYIKEKERIVSAGVCDTDDYAKLKQAVIKRILGDAYEE